MHNSTYVWVCILILFVTVYFTRMIPLVFCSKPIQNKFFRSLLAYLPYAILTSLLIPEVFQDHYGLIPGILGFITALIFAYLDKSLILVLSAATVVTYVCMMLGWGAPI